MRQHGKVLYPVILGVRLTSDQAALLRQAAANDDRPPGALARRIIVEHLSKEQTVTANTGGSAT